MIQGSYEHLGAFYLGTEDAAGQPVLYDSKDLKTHGLCVGMTGSGKTGLCITLLEEAALDGIPIIAIDPKGDLANLALTFPDLRPADFAPFVDEEEAARNGRTRNDEARVVAERWREGLAASGIGSERLAAFRDKVEVAIYTPGSTSCRPLSILNTLAAPSAKLAENPDGLRERVTATVSGLLSLLGRDADPIQSREHILLSTLITQAWQEGRSLTLVDLVGAIAEPPFDRVGALDLDMFFPSAARKKFAIAFNNLLAAPSFAGWLEGEPLDIQRLLWTPNGKPRVSVLSISHLHDSERMFFVTLLLQEVLAWLRSQPGASSLRALLYMDEVFGFFPPVANPPSKRPMLTLLKQARAFGLGILLATQNPVDLDYKGLANCGTWLLGRLQAERDVERVVEGLAGAVSATGQPFDKTETRRLLAGLEQRQFLLHNVHDDGPLVFHTRFAMSYLAGPLTRGQLKGLMTQQGPTSDATRPSEPTVAERFASPQANPAPEPPNVAGQARSVKPTLDVDIEQLYLAGEAGLKRYQPMLLVTVLLHYAHRHSGIDQWLEPSLLIPLPVGRASHVAIEQATWHRLSELDLRVDAAIGVEEYAMPSGKVLTKSGLRQFEKRLKSQLCSRESITIWYCPSRKLWSTSGETEDAFAARVQADVRAERDRKVEALRQRFAPRFRKLDERLRRAQQRLAKERGQRNYQGLSTAVGVGTSLVAALFGRRSTARQVGTTARRAGRTAQEFGDVQRAEEDVVAVQRQLEAMEGSFEEASAELQNPVAPAIEQRQVRPRKADLAVQRLALVWCPARTGR